MYFEKIAFAKEGFEGRRCTHLNFWREISRAGISLGLSAYRALAGVSYGFSEWNFFISAFFLLSHTILLSS